MDGIVSLLDERHDRLVRDLWTELAHDWGVRNVADRVPFPHFSYQLAVAYDMARIRRSLQHLSTELHPFIMRTGGLGIFTRPQPVLYISVCRSATLSALHQTICDHLSTAGCGLDVYYRPEQWTPHITLAQGDLNPTLLGRIVAAFSTRSFAWEITINQLALISTTDTGSILRQRFALGHDIP